MIIIYTIKYISKCSEKNLKRKKVQQITSFDLVSLLNIA